MSHHGRRPTVAVVGTGGTIAGSMHSTSSFGYTPATLTVEELIASVPGLEALAELRPEQLIQVDSADIDATTTLSVACRTAELLADDNVDGVVITHGSDTLEETSYLLHLTLDSPKPVVFVASMRPSDGLSADGPRNLRNAVATAASESSRDRGVLIVMNDEIHTARDASKTHTLNVSSVQSPHGALGYVVNDLPRFYRTPARPHTHRTSLHVDQIRDLPRVDILYAHADMSALMVEAIVESGPSALICAGFGNGNFPSYIYETLKAARATGIHVVRASRGGSGPLVRNGEAPDDALDWVTADDQNPQKARILAALALTTSQEARRMQQAFWTY